MRGAADLIGGLQERTDVIRGLQERAARAFPAERTVVSQGWWLRQGSRAVWWSGPVLPHGAVAPGHLERRVAEVERFFDDHGGVPRYQITPGVCPDGLDALLAARGYRLMSPMSLQVADTSEVLGRLGPGALPVEVQDRLTRPWFDVWRSVHSGGDDLDAAWAMLARVTQPSAFACATVGDDVVAVGRAVSDTGWAGVFSMATLPAARGRGAARAVLTALAAWARDQRTDRMYLQVERDNKAAWRLYGRAGFTELCGYHYRTAG